MRLPLSMTLLLIAGASASVGACGPNVILDGMSTSSGSGGNGSTTGMAFGGSTATFAVGTSVANTVGVGGSVSSTGSFGPGAGGGSIAETSTASVGTGGFTVASSVTVGTGGFTVASSVTVGTTATSTGTGVMGACTDGPDEAFLNGEMLYSTLVKCATANLNNPGGLTMCIESATGLSSPCVDCISADVQCSLKDCLNVCGADPNGTACQQCRNKSCEGAFLGCSGLLYAPGSVSCSDVLFDPTKGTGWKLGVPAEAFVTTPGFQDYNALQTCACNLIVPEGCQSVCDDADTNGPPDFCNGAVASNECTMCLETTCGGQLMNCQAN